MLPFDLYPGKGRARLGMAKGGNCRQGYGLQFMLQTGRRQCAYCGIDLVTNYESWLTLVLDHVIPASACKSLRISPEWRWDFSNTVLSCAACNGFCNRYALPSDIVQPETLESFYDIRDRIFVERKQLIRLRHEEERRFFDGLPHRLQSRANSATA